MSDFGKEDQVFGRAIAHNRTQIQVGDWSGLKSKLNYWLQTNFNRI